MRVLVAGCADENAFPHMVPLAMALRAGGHEVHVAGRPRFTEVISQAGLDAVPVGRDNDVWDAFGVPVAERAALRTAMIEPYDVVGQDERFITREYLRSGYDYHVTWWHKMDNLPVIAQLVTHAQQWRPALVLWEPTCYAGPVAAKAVGAAHARFLPYPDIYGVTREHFLRLRRPGDPDPLGDWLAGYATRYGATFTEDMITGELTIDQLPGSLRLDHELPYTPVRYTPWPAPGGTGVPPARPRIAVHGGELTAQLTAIHCGVPQLALPRYVDEPPLAQRIADRGAGLRVHPRTLTSAIVRKSVHRLMTEPSFHDSAARLRDEMLTMPAPHEVVPRLEELAAAHR
jgi:hypothetical protein